MAPERSGVLGVVGVGAAACAACCVGPLLAVVGGLGIGGLTLVASGSVVLAGVLGAVIGVTLHRHRRRRRTATMESVPVTLAARDR